MAIGERIKNTDNNGQENSSSFELIEPKHTMADLIVADNTRSALLDFLALKDYQEKVFHRWGLKRTHSHRRQNSVNFYGAPGTGKTMAAHVVSSEMESPLILASYAELESKYVGETSKNITALFKYAKDSNAIIFFDEADAILSRRVTNMTHATDVSVNQTRSVLLTLLDNHDGLVIFATNFIENYDPAFMRRILSHIEFVLPDFQARHDLWRKYIPSELPTNTNINTLSSISSGLSGSDISNAVMKAAFSAARQEDALVSDQYFHKAINEILNSKKENTYKNSFGWKRESREVSSEYIEETLKNDTLKEVKK